MNKILQFVASTALLLFIVFSAELQAQEEKNPFVDNWLPSPKEGSFKMDGFIVWGGSVIKGEDGYYYMFASRWPKTEPGVSWATNSEIVLAKSNKAEGPYEFQKVVLPPRGKEYWDGMMTHNPTIHYHKGKYLLFYIGLTYDFEKPEKETTRTMYETVWNRKRVGLAIADSPYGPWIRMDKPLMEPRPDKWDAVVISNPAVAVHDDGSVLLIYKSAPVPYPARNQNRKLSFGVARADHYLGPYKRVEEENEIVFNPKNCDVEDPYIWYDGEKYNMLTKTMYADFVGVKGGGIYATSNDGRNWFLSDEPMAYDRNIEFEDGTKALFEKMERPQVLIQDGKITHVFFASKILGGDGFNMVRPLKQK